MEQLSFSAASRRNADKNLLIILLVGLGSSLAFHIVTIAGVAHWWKPVTAIDEPMEITMVDVDTEKPPAKPLSQPTVVPIVKAPAKVEPKPEPKPEAAKAVPIVKVPAQVTQKAAPSAKTTPPINSSPARVPVQAIAPPAFPEKLFKTAPAKISAPPKLAKSPTVAAPKAENRSKPVGKSTNRKPATQLKNTPVPTEEIAPSDNNQSGLASKPTNNELADRLSANNASLSPDDNFETVAPKGIKASTTDEFMGSSNNQSGLASKPTSNGKLSSKLAGDAANSNTAGDDNFGDVAPSKIKAPANEDFARANKNQSGLASKPTSGRKLGGGLARNVPDDNTANDGDPNSIDQGNSWRGAKANPGAGLKPSSGSSKGNNALPEGIQCINRCEISGLTDLEDRDGGKDKLRIKIAVNPKGNVTSASIAKSSGNSTIDQAVINGVRQMQFSPPGKMVEAVVKANVLL